MLASLLACQKNKGIVLIDAGHSEYKILVEQDADSLIQTAALALQQELEAITTAPIEITHDTSMHPLIKVGRYYRPNFNLLDQDAVAYWIEDSDIIISGGSPSAIVHSVYDFLEREVQFLFLAPDVTIRPDRASKLKLTKDMAYSYVPPVSIRTVHADLFYLHPEFAAKRKVTTEAFPGYAEEARVHTFHRFLPPSEYYASHPEYYALRNGKRVATEPCLTHPDVLEIIKDKVQTIISDNQQARVISVSQNDNTQYCQCPSCEAIHSREGSPAGSMIAFVNKVAEAYPHIQISTLAYQYTRKAPSTIRPASNVLITLCSIECDRSAPIAEKCHEFEQDLKEWSKLTSNIRIWDYTTQFTNFLAPFPNLRTIRPNIDLFVSNNAQWIFEQHSRNPSDLYELRAYLMSQLLWDPKQDEQALISRFTQGYYQQAAPYIDDYITRMHDAMARDSSFFLFLYGDPAQGFDSWLSADNMTIYEDLLDQAEESVKGQPHLVSRVRAARLGLDYAILEYGRKGMQSQPIGRIDLLQRLKRFNNTCSEHGITAMNEIRLTVEEYIASYLSAIQRSQQTNIARDKKVSLLTQPKKYADENPQSLTDGALGGLNFYSNWLGFEGNDAEAVIDLGAIQEVSYCGTAFLQVTNHLVFFPKKVAFLGSLDGETYEILGSVQNRLPIQGESKINDIQAFEIQFAPKKVRFIKMIGKSLLAAPEWHNGSGLPAWIFVDEIIVS